MRKVADCDLMLNNYKKQKTKSNLEYSQICGDDIYVLQSPRLENRTLKSYETDTQTPYDACVRVSRNDKVRRKRVCASEPRNVKRKLYKTSSNYRRLIPFSAASASDLSEMEEMISPTIHLPTQTLSQQSKAFPPSIWDRVSVNGHYEFKQPFRIVPVNKNDKERRTDDRGADSDSQVGHSSHSRRSRLDKNTKSTQSYFSDEEKGEDNSLPEQVEPKSETDEKACDHTNCVKYFIVKKLGPDDSEKKMRKNYGDQSVSEFRRVTTPPVSRCVTVVTDNYNRKLESDRPIKVKPKPSVRAVLEEDMVLLNKTKPDQRDYTRKCDRSFPVCCDHAPIYPEQMDRFDPPTFHYIRPRMQSVEYVKPEQSLQIQQSRGGKDLIVSPSGEYYIISSDDGRDSTPRSIEKNGPEFQNDRLPPSGFFNKRASYPEDSDGSKYITGSTRTQLVNNSTDSDSSDSSIGRKKIRYKSTCWKRKPTEFIPYHVPYGSPNKYGKCLSFRDLPSTDFHCHKADGRRLHRDLDWETARLAPEEPKRKDEFLGYTSREGQRYKVYVDEVGDDYMELQGRKLCIPSSLYDPCTRSLELVDKQGKPLSSGDRLIGYDKYGNALLEDRRNRKYVLKVDKRLSLTDQQLEEQLTIAKRSGRPSSGELRCNLIGYSRKMHPLLRTTSGTLLELRGTRLDVVSDPPKLLRNKDGSHLDSPLNSPRQLVWQKIDGVRVYTLLEPTVLLTVTKNYKSG